MTSVSFLVKFPIHLMLFTVPQKPFSLIIINYRSCFLTSVIYYSGIRDHIIAKSMCVCGATDVLADDLLPNKTLRDTINRILESGNSSAENAGSMCQIQGILFSHSSFIFVCTIIGKLKLTKSRYGVCTLSTSQGSITYYICCI